MTARGEGRRDTSNEIAPQSDIRSCRFCGHLAVRSRHGLVVAMTAVEHGPTPFQRALTWVALALTVVLLILGIAWYGFSLDVHQRFWSDIFGRISGPMTFRFFLQPTMALIAAIPDGLRDAREGHAHFFWTAHGDDSVKHGRLREGLYATARILLLGLSMDMIYQYKVFDQFYPVEAVLFALVLAVIPYFIWRWIVERLARWRIHGSGAGAMGSPDE
jgi:hypothetical protein